MGRTCEGCKCAPPGGPYDLHDYCRWCNADLCAECMRNKRCPESEDGKHERDEEDDE